MLAPVPRLSAECVIALVNEWASVPQEVSFRPWNGYPAPDSPFRRRLAAEWGDASIPDDEEIAAAADAVYPAFAESDVEDRMRILNSLSESLRLTPQVSADANGRTVMGWAVPAQSDRLLAGMVATLVRAFADDGELRLGICGADHCADVFTDESPRRNRVYCSTRCQTRQRVRAYRARHHADSATSGKS